MNNPRRRVLLLAAGAALTAMSVALLSGHEAQSQTSRTIKFVVPFAPGGGVDILTRLTAEQIGRTHGQTIVVENRPGAGTIIGTEAVARAAPDGNTVLFVANSFVINPNLKKLNYDPLTSFEPICNLTLTPNVVAVHAASPYRTLGDLVNAARAKPGELTMGVNGPATSQHFGFELLKRAANVNITYIPFPGGSPAVTALLGQHVTSIYSSYASAAEQLKAGTLRALAVASRNRIEPRPDIPTVTEAGYNDAVEEAWFGTVAPARSPKETIAQLAAWFAAAIHAPEIKAKLAAQELYPIGVCGAEFAVHLRQQYDAYGRIIREANIKAE